MRGQFKFDKIGYWPEIKLEFAKVPKPIPMRNSKGAIVYYLFFASKKDAAEQIVIDIFKKYENRGAL